MELHFIDKLYENKSVINPVNPEEVFTCKDLFADYRICKKERRQAVYTKDTKMRRCFDLRALAYKCYTYSEEEFLTILIDKYQEKRRYVEYLEKEGSLLADKYMQKNKVFAVRESDIRQQMNNIQ